MAFWKAQHLPGLRLTANGTQNDKAEAGSNPVLTTKNKVMKKLLGLCLLITMLTACGGGQYEDSTNNTDVILIAEKDSIRVYRAINNGSIIYFTNKGGVAIH